MSPRAAARAAALLLALAGPAAAAAPDAAVRSVTVDGTSFRVTLADGRVLAAWCTDQGCGRTDPNPVRGQAVRT